MQSFGVHSEVGTLRTVLVCLPGLAHQRLTPGNRADLLFDDVLWVHEAQKDGCGPEPVLYGLLLLLLSIPIYVRLRHEHSTMSTVRG